MTHVRDRLRPTRLAIIGFGALGKACATLAGADSRIEVAGFVRRPDNVEAPRSAPFHALRTVAHVSELGRIDVALVCVPMSAVADIARDLIQREVPVIECAAFHGEEFDAHTEALRRLAARHRVTVIVGAGWDPGALSLMRGLFAALIPKGTTDIGETTGIHTHHTTFEHAIPGIKRAMSSEVHTSEGRLQRYVYVEVEPGTDFRTIEAHIRSDTVAPGVEIFVFPLTDAAHDETHGIVLQRHGSVAGRPQFLLLEARIGEVTLAAQMMLAAALAVPTLERRCYTVFELPLTALSGAPSLAAWRQRWS